MSDRKPGDVIAEHVMCGGWQETVLITINGLNGAISKHLSPAEARQLAADLIHFAEEVEKDG